MRCCSVDRRQDPDQHHVRAHRARALLGAVEAAAHGLLELGGDAPLEQPRRDVDLDVELAELGLEVGVGDRLERAGVHHRRVALLVGEVQLDLEPDGAALGVEARLAQHAREHVEAGPHLLAVALPVLAREDRRGDFLSHGVTLSSTAHVNAVHLHHVQAVPGPPARQAGARGHLPVLPARGQDRRARRERRRQVDAAADHGRAGHGVSRRRSARARRHRRPARAGAAARPDQGRARQRRGRSPRAARHAPPLQRAGRELLRGDRRRVRPPAGPHRRRRRVAARHHARDRDGRAAAAARRRRRRHPVRRRAPPRRALPAAAPAPDLLLLDEPTNHLDAESVAWLEKHLEDYKGTVVAVTHDRYFLDNVAGWILELDRGRGIPFKGNYSAWLEQKQARLAQEERQESARPAHDRARARVGARVAEGTPHQGARAAQPLRGAARRGARREARPGADPHPGRAAARRRGGRGRRACARATATAC